MTKRELPAVFSQMLLSFVTLARLLNLTKAVRELGTTRQTIHRHIKELEKLKGTSLFEVVDRQYQLTAAGKRAYSTAEALLSQSASWVDDERTLINGLVHVSFNADDGTWLYAQQHPLKSAWSLGRPLIKRGLEAWTTAESQLEHKAMRKVRPYLLVYREYDDEWLFVEVGEKSSYTSWLGEARAKSSIGRRLSSDPVYLDADKIMMQAYRHVAIHGGHWYEHVSTCLPRGEGKRPQPVSYQKLVSACTFPDGTPAVSVLIVRTNHIKIENLDPTRTGLTLQEDLMDFEI